MKVILSLLLLITMSCQDKSPPKEIPVPDVDITVPNSPSGEPPIIEPDPATLPPTPEPPKPEPVGQSPSVEAAPSLSLAGVKLVGATAAQRAKYEKALKVVASVLKDPEFSKRVMAHKYNGASGFASSSDSPKTVLRKLFEGSETYKKSEIDREADLEVRFYYANNRTVGYTYPKVGYIMVNTKFFNNYTPASVAANFIHEYLHKLGYGHDSSATARRPYSVPYGIGGIMKAIGKKYE